MITICAYLSVERLKKEEITLYYWQIHTKNMVETNKFPNGVTKEKSVMLGGEKWSIEQDFLLLWVLCTCTDPIETKQR